MKICKLFAMGSLLSIAFITYAQRPLQVSAARPAVGKPMPDFTLNNITHYKTRSASLKDFEGKWLFLDFWSPSCVTCIQSFSKVNAYYNEFKDKLTWVMVGLNNQKYNKGIEQFYEKMRVKQNLNMIAAYDSVLVDQWSIPTLPHIIIISPKGIVHSITAGNDMTTEKIKNLLNGKAVSFSPKNTMGTKHDTAATINYSNSEVLYCSMLSKWNGEKIYRGCDIDYYIQNKIYLIDKSKGYNFAMTPLYALYNIAYFGYWSWGAEQPSLFGKVYPKPILELKDTSLFQFNFNFEGGKGTYNYHLTIPSTEVTKERIMTLMQEDLKRVFKYEVSIETRKMSVWKLIAEPGTIEKLKTKGGKRYATPGTHAAGYTLRNWPPQYLIAGISFYIADKYSEPFVDETGVTGNIDFTIDADMTNIKDIQKEIHKQGLRLIKGYKEMRVMVIREPVAKSN